MGLEDILVRMLNHRRPHRPMRSSGFYVGEGEGLISRERGPFFLSASPPRHTFFCGRTGSGKTTALQRIIFEHIQRGIPFFSVDFHGPATRDILAMLGDAPEPRPAILIEPWSDRIVGWNPIAAHSGSPYPIVQELVSVFHRRLWPDAWGPRLEELLRQGLLALSQAKLTLLDATAFLSRSEFRRAVLRHCTLPEVREFWTLRFERLSPSQRALTTETVLNKVGVFHDPAIRYLVGQQSGALDFDDALRNGVSILANFSSGELRGNCYLVAALLVAAFKNAVYRRPTNARPYSVILDEFQEMLVLEDIDHFLRSFRKFNCSAYLATQQIAASPELKASIFSNSSVFMSFATSAADATFLGKEFGGADGELAARLLPELKTGRAIVKVRGEAARLVRVSRPPVAATADVVTRGRERCLMLGKSRQEIDAEIVRRTTELSGPSIAAKTAIQTSEQGYGSELPEGYE